MLSEDELLFPCPCCEQLHILRSGVMTFVPYADGKTIQFSQGTLTIEAVQIAIRCAKRETHRAMQPWRGCQELESRLHALSYSVKTIR